MGQKLIRSEACSLDEIRFKSKMERCVYERLCMDKFPCEYEPEKIALLEGFRFMGKTISALYYTPDFVTSTRSGKKVYIEVKGYANEGFPIKMKMFMHKLLREQPEAMCFTVTNIDTLSDLMHVLREETMKSKKR